MSEINLDEIVSNDEPPYHMVNNLIGKHIGPFTTYIDAALARTIATDGWATAPILNKTQFEAWLHGQR